MSDLFREKLADLMDMKCIVVQQMNMLLRVFLYSYCLCLYSSILCFCSSYGLHLFLSRILLYNLSFFHYNTHLPKYARITIFFSIHSLSLSVNNIPCRCILSVFLCPNSVMSQCFILLPVSFLHLSKNRLTAKVATALLSWIFISLHNLSNSSSLNVSVINMPLLTFNSSLSLTCHSLFFLSFTFYTIPTTDRHK